MNRTFSFEGRELFTDNRLFCVSIAFYYALAVMNRVLFSLMPGNAVLSLFIRVGTYGLIFLILIGLTFSDRRLTVLIFLEAVVAVLFLTSIIAGNIGSTNWIKVYKLIATTYIPLAIAANCITDRKMLMACFHSIAVVSVPFLIMVAVLSYRNWDQSYDMSLGYVMVFTVLVLLAQFKIDSKVYNLILAGGLSLFILFVGSRGPFICIIAFFVIELFLSERYSAEKKIAVIFFVSLIVGIIWVNLDKILMSAYALSVNMGFNSRSIFLLMQGKAISHDSGRSGLQEHYIDLIGERPFEGYGIMGAWISDGMYPHNIILEVILAFGYPVGILILGAMIYILASAVRRARDKYSNALLILFISYCFHLLVSGTYLKVWQFFVCTAICFPNKGRIF